MELQVPITSKKGAMTNAMQLTCTCNLSILHHLGSVCLLILKHCIQYCPWKMQSDQMQAIFWSMQMTLLVRLNQCGRKHSFKVYTSSGLLKSFFLMFVLRFFLDFHQEFHVPPLFYCCNRQIQYFVNFQKEKLN